MPALYTNDEGMPVITNSMAKCFRECPRKAMYTYVDRLKPRVHSTPLRRGTWIHNLLEAHYKGEDWREAHRLECQKYSELFDEEKQKLGDLPTECAQLMRSYLWHYGDDPHGQWNVVAVEQSYDAELPDGTIVRGKIDLLVEIEGRLYAVDHKTHKTLPDFRDRLMDPQSVFYIWILRQNGIEVEGFIWNYLRTKGLGVPKLLKDGSRLSYAAVDTDYVTYLTAIKKYQKENGLKITPEIKATLDWLRGHRYKHGMPQTSTFFKREEIQKDDDMIRRVVAENWHTSKRINKYNFRQRDAVERNYGRSCSFMCSYEKLCSVELTGGNPTHVLRDFRVGDALDYYQDQKDRREV